MTRLWIVSDLHTDASPWSPRLVPDHDVLVIAGDVSNSPEAALDEVSKLHRRTRKPVIFVPGNHDHFNGDLLAFHGTGSSWPVYVLSSGEAVVLDGVRFVGATLWTDWCISDKEFAAQSWAARHMPDYAYITRPEGELIWPIDLFNQNRLHRARVEAALAARHSGPTVVVTHHAPSSRSLAPGEERLEEAGAYASDLEGLMLGYAPDLWVHGHIHRSSDYRIGETRVLCNPRGYVSDDWSERTGWQEDLIVEV